MSRRIFAEPARLTPLRIINYQLSIHKYKLLSRDNCYDRLESARLRPSALDQIYSKSRVFL